MLIRRTDVNLGARQALMQCTMSLKAFHDNRRQSNLSVVTEAVWSGGLWDRDYGSQFQTEREGGMNYVALYTIWSGSFPWIYRF